ncbi:hypothetical protein AB9F46_02475 [Rhizobium leguminosarum]|uniref:hypothetical protein n=1 Tax=Rhizobium leguminosarum TaxID=384 RepID=UPI003F9A350C
MSDENGEQGYGIWWVPLILSAVYITAAICLIGSYAHHDVNCDGAYSCLTVEDWGTFLSGVFAPLAFIWLVISVRIQASELKAQREELQQSREVMTEQAAFIGAQTRILEAQWLNQQRDNQLREFDECLTSLVALLKFRLNGDDFLVGTVRGGQGKGELGVYADPTVQRDEFLAQFGHQLHTSPGGKGFGEPIRFADQYRAVGEEALTLCNTLIHMAKQLQGFSALTIGRLRIERLIEDLHRMVSTD